MPTKNCLDCGSAFYTSSIAVRCETCRKIYSKKQAKERNRRYHKVWIAIPENRERHAQQSKAHYNANIEYYKEYQKRYYQDKLQDKRRLSKLQKITIEVEGQEVILFVCERLGLKAKHLPCGDRWECWGKQPCKHVPRGKEKLEYGEDRGTLSWFEKSKIKPVFEED